MLILNFKIKREINEKINLYSRFIDCSFKSFKTIGKKELSGLLKVMHKTMLLYCFKCRERQKIIEIVNR